MAFEKRIDYAKVSPEPLAAMVALERAVHASGLEAPLLELVRIRASQINGCAFCLDMHTKDARAAHESEQRIYALDAWREAPFYSERERAALAWTEALTELHPDHVSDTVYAHARGVFSEKEIVDLTFAVMAINSWNRLAISMRSVAGTYRPSGG